jgi:hypothetical protein
MAGVGLSGGERRRGLEDGFDDYDELTSRNPSENVACLDHQK